MASKYLEILSRKYWNQFDNGVALTSNMGVYSFFYLGFIGGRFRRSTEFQLQQSSAASSDNHFSITSGDNTITRESGSWKDDGFTVGDTIYYKHSGGHNQHNTITYITDLVITCQDNFTATEDSADPVVYLTIPQLGFNYYSNLIENDETTTFISKVDGSSRKHTFELICTKANSSNTFSITNGAKTITRTSGSWLDDGFSNGDTIYYSNPILSGHNQANTINTVTDLVITCVNNFTATETTTATAIVHLINTWIAGIPTGFSSWSLGTGYTRIKITQIATESNLFTQKFEIQEIFDTLPLFDTIDGIDNGDIPDYYAEDNSLRYICKIDALPTLYNPILIHTITDDTVPDTLGNCAYYDEHFNGYNPIEFTLDEITYTVGGVSATAIALDSTTSFTIKLNSVNNVFTSSSKFKLNIFKLTEYDDIDNDLNFQENFVFDYVLATADGSSNAGVNSILDSVSASVVSDQLVITGTISYTLAQQLLLEDEKYAISVATLNPDLAYAVSDCVNVLVDVNDYYKDTDIPDLVNMDYAYFYEHPNNEGTNAKTSYRGWVEDGILSVVDNFYVDLSKLAVLNKLTIRLVADNGTDYFEIEAKEFDFTDVPIKNGIQEIAVDEERGFLLEDSSQFNYVKITKGSKIGDLQYYTIKWALKAHWMDYLSLSDVDEEFYDATQLNDGFNQLISNYSSKEGYEIKLFWDFEVNNGTVSTNYRFKSPDLDIYEYDEDENAEPLWVCTGETFDTSDNNLNKGILQDENTKIKITFTSNGYGAVNTNDIYGIIRLEEYQNGGLYNKWELSSLRTSADDNPLIPLSGESYVKITTTTDDIILECQIDYTKIKQGVFYLVSGRIGATCVDIPETRANCQINVRISDIYALYPSLSFSANLRFDGAYLLPIALPIIDLSTPISYSTNFDDFVDDIVNAANLNIYGFEVIGEVIYDMIGTPIWLVFNIIAPAGTGDSLNLVLFPLSYSINGLWDGSSYLSSTTSFQDGIDAAPCSLPDVSNYKLTEDNEEKITEESLFFDINKTVE